MAYGKELRKITVLKTAHGTTQIINHDATNNQLNTFLAAFSIWAQPCNVFAEHKLAADGIHKEVWFEADGGFYDLVQAEPMVRAIQWHGVDLIVQK